MRRATRMTAMTVVGLVMLMGSSCAVSSADDRSELLKVPESVWRVWFANDTKTLGKLVPPDIIVISAGRSSGRPRQRCFELPLSFKREVESLFSSSSHTLRLSALGMSQLFGVRIWWKQKQTGNDR